MNEQKKDVIDLTEVWKLLKTKKKVFFIVLPIVFVLSCLYIFPQPRYYRCSVKLAPETTSENVAGGLSSLASQFGVNLGGATQDAIYPLLYPDVVSSNEFVIGLLGINVKSVDGLVNTDYYNYMSKLQKKNPITAPVKKVMRSVTKLFASKDQPGPPNKGAGMSAFRMSKKDSELLDQIKSNISCDVDKKTEVITIKVEDQDPLICATMADSVRNHLQTFITKYRTNKARVDVEHYEKLAKQSKREYEYCVREYSAYCDANQDVMLQSFISKRDELENEMQLKFNAYSAMRTQLEAMRAKLQEKTPAFTTIESATVPVKPAGPKRIIFIFGMCFLATFVTALWLARKQLFTKA
ncbi:chain-length determining protein [Prevotella sp.]|uniref:chain-length determining protein n=1 Tax=Prevotella sp. TaxID=59823 RepID=UPI0025E52181|nr:chain-length determining protein [Prevotella sp.]